MIGINVLYVLNFNNYQTFMIVESITKYFLKFTKVMTATRYDPMFAFIWLYFYRFN